MLEIGDTIKLTHIERGFVVKVKDNYILMYITKIKDFKFTRKNFCMIQSRIVLTEKYEYKHMLD